MLSDSLLDAVDTASEGLEKIKSTAKTTSKLIRNEAESFALQIDSAKDSVVSQLGPYIEFIGGLELRDITFDASGINSRDFDDSF